MLEREIQLPENKDFFLLGPRQTGKTTLLHHFLKNRRFLEINFLKTSVFRKYAESPSLLLEEVAALDAGITHVFLDEVQRVPEMLNDVQSLIDSKVRQKFVMSGSSARKLKRQDANTLGGRAWNFTLFPLTVNEMGGNFNLKQTLSYGSLPQIFLSESTSDRIGNLEAYVDMYLEQEIKAEALSRKIGAFARFLKVAAQTNGELINYSSIAKDVGLNYMTVQDYFSILEDTLIGNFLLPIHHSERKRHKQSPKFYFFDTGVLRAVQGRLAIEAQPGTFEFGNCFETFIINEVQRINTYRKKRWTLGFLRTVNDVEVDLVIESPDSSVLGVEIKSKVLPDYRDFGAGYEALKKLLPKAQFMCVCTGDSSRLVNGVRVEPYAEFLNWLRSHS